MARPSRGRPEWYYGSHPPACTCVGCSGGRRSQRNRRQGGRGIDPRPAPTSRPPTTPGGSGPWGKILVVALIAAAIGGAVVYGVMVYLGSSDDQGVSQAVAAVPIPSPIPTVVPTATPFPAVGTGPIPTNTPVPTETPAPTPTSTPIPKATATPTAQPPTEREVVVNAFAECDGQYSGRDKDFRLYAADNAISEGRQTVADIRALVKEHCGGAFPAMVEATGSESPAETSEALVAMEPTPTARPTATPAPVPTSTTVPSPELRHIEEKGYMLELINAERERASVGVIALGENIAAQLHAEAALANCFSSHWSLDGLKPYMRYVLAGGYHSNSENGHGSNYCIKAAHGYAAAGNIQQRIRNAIDGWMKSAGHRRNILDPQHKKVNIGLAWDRYNTVMYQHFEGDYVEYDRRPSIANGVLSLSGETKNGAQLGKNLGQQIYFDPPPRKLTLGQVARTYCYDNGRPVASLRKPLTGGYYYSTHEFTTRYSPCPSPYDVPANAAPARSHNEAHQLWRQAYNTSQSRASQSITVPWITASEWTVSDTTFLLKADISEILDKHGSGVYSLLLWGKINGADTVISQYSIFHDVTPPDAYDPSATN